MPPTLMFVVRAGTSTHRRPVEARPELPAGPDCGRAWRANLDLRPHQDDHQAIHADVPQDHRLCGLGSSVRTAEDEPHAPLRVQELAERLLTPIQTSWRVRLAMEAL